MTLVDIIAGPVFKIIDKLIPDPAAKMAAQQKILEMQQAGEFKEIDTQLQRDLAQIQVNLAEANSGSLFKSGWRPFIGWICGFALGYEFLFRVILTYFLHNMLGWGDAPNLDLGDLLTILGGILGLGTLRTVEKSRGVS